MSYVLMSILFEAVQRVLENIVINILKVTNESNLSNICAVSVLNVFIDVIINSFPDIVFILSTHKTTYTCISLFVSPCGDSLHTLD